MSTEKMNDIKANGNAENHQTEARQTDFEGVVEGPWKTDWRNVQLRRLEGRGIEGDQVIHQKKVSKLAGMRDIPRSRASYLMRHQDVDVPMSELEL